MLHHTLFSVCQRYIFFANHNLSLSYCSSYCVVFSMSKIHFFCESQHCRQNIFNCLCCFQYVKDTFFLRITTQWRTRKILPKLFSVCQRYIFFANHNWLGWCNSDSIVVFSMSKIHFFCESQPWSAVLTTPLRCFQYVKDTFFLRITTVLTISCSTIRLFSVCQRYIFFANHNTIIYGTDSNKVVFSMSKIHFLLRRCLAAPRHTNSGLSALGLHKHFCESQLRFARLFTQDRCLSVCQRYVCLTQKICHQRNKDTKLFRIYLRVCYSATFNS